MNTHLGNILYWAGVAGATVSILYTIDVILVHQSGRSLLQISGRFVSREDMLAKIGIGIAVALAFWGGGAAARYLVNKAAEKHPPAK